jgi:hypothetical protein
MFTNESDITGFQFCLLEQRLQGLAQAAHGGSGGSIGRLWATVEQLGQPWEQDAAVELGEEQGEADAVSR